MVSPAGHCRPFDVRADGTIFGSGVAVVVLKPLQAAVDDGDRIHAVIRGSAINNDGSTKMAYAAPNAAGQADVIAEAHAVADVDASTISYVETHGTGTPLGDPVEIEGLRRHSASPTRPGLARASSVRSSPTSVTWSRGRNRRPDQDDSVPPAPGHPRHAALHQPQPGTAPGPEALSSCDRVRPVGVGRRSGGPGSARSVSVVPTRTSSSKRRPGPARAAAGPAGAVVVGPHRRGLGSRGPWPPNCPALTTRTCPTSHTPSRAAGKRTSGWRRS